MAMYLKANVAYRPMVDEINRKFVPRKQVCSKTEELGPVTVLGKGWMGGACRNTYRAGIGAAKRNFLVVRENARMTPPSANEQENRSIFAEAVSGRNWIKQDLQQISRVQQMWHQATVDPSKEINGVSAYGYTFYGWIFAVQFAGKKEDSSYNTKNFPQSFDA